MTRAPLKVHLEISWEADHLRLWGHYTLNVTALQIFAMGIFADSEHPAIVSSQCNYPDFILCKIDMTISLQKFSFFVIGKLVPFEHICVSAGIVLAENMPSCLSVLHNLWYNP